MTCLGTTKAAAGSIEEQRKIDLDLNLELAKAAKAEGIETVSIWIRQTSSLSSHAKRRRAGEDGMGWVEEGGKLKLIISSLPFLSHSLSPIQFILLSSTGASATSYSPYTKMKVSQISNRIDE